jgi:hypothetical protein
VAIDPWTEFWEGHGQPARPLFLQPGEPPSRPSEPARIRFEDVWPYAYDGSLVRYRGKVVPFELARVGDEQVAVLGRFGAPAGGPAAEPEAPAALDGLAGFPSVTSVVASSAILLRRPLPAVRELLVVSGPAPDNETLTNLPNLERLSLGRAAPGSKKVDLRLLAAMPLRDLRFRAWHVSTIEPLSTFAKLERLRIEETTFESISPVASCTALRWLAIGYWKGVSSLGRLAELERAEITEATLSDLRRLRGWTRLRSLQLTGRRVRSLTGIESMTGLQDLFLFSTGVDDLGPLGSISLNRLRIDIPPKGFRLDGLAELRSLRSLVLRLGDGSVPSLRPLAGLNGLEELAVMGLVLDRDLGPLLGLRHLRRLRLIGDFGAGEAELRRRLRETSIEIVHPPRASDAPGFAVGPVPVTALPDDAGWTIFADLAAELGVADNLAAEARVHDAIAQRDADLVDRLEFDSEPERLSIFGRTAADLRAAAEIVADLIAPTTPSS